MVEDIAVIPMGVDVGATAPRALVGHVVDSSPGVFARGVRATGHDAFGEALGVLLPGEYDQLRRATLVDRGSRRSVGMPRGARRSPTSL
ncbi:hypothetical protein ACFFSW_17805 [Saccharothrix longispora]|uniref:Uncharacterized protein n=1 Tax=Saccharothrix longispora TaxID=33920 RepID=A0ABU1PSE8_9PSEU|nr:hypothetical protein [Saccharothrix longispora]MDR6593568.1 hypothetical protein [Saccharothrix longispora]